ncbi:hypothetical protein ABE060_21855 [Bacillus rugosus]|uniref:hypothetical protein n=1 Tax=Bacillus rugosus TaxID=2715209 RepID=UPI001FE9CCC3|nr:hypothetical protein [Bacillus rugosus]
MICFFSISSTHASALDFDYTTDFILNDSTKTFVLENISDVPAIDYFLGYQFTILGANTCSVEVKLQRMGLMGEYTTLSTRQFSGSWFILVLRIRLLSIHFTVTVYLQKNIQKTAQVFG